MNGVSEKEAQVNEYINAGNGEAAVKLLFELVQHYAKNKDFAKAEELRDKLYEADAGALTEIIEAGDIIEEEKSKSIDKRHSSVWKDLYETLTSEEVNTLHFAMKEENFEPHRLVFKQGEKNSKLYLINHGHLKIIFHNNGNEFLVKNLKPGEIAGEDTFFSNTAFSTTSLQTTTRVKLNSLDKSFLKKWDVDHPSIQVKLFDYCSKIGLVTDLLENKGMDRRVHKRVDITSRGQIQLLDSSKAPSGKPVKMTLLDISISGLSFFLKITKRETVSLLLGRSVIVSFSIDQGTKEMAVSKMGTVVGVRYHAFSDYSIHIRFEELLDRRVIETIETEAARLQRPS